MRGHVDVDGPIGAAEMNDLLGVCRFQPIHDCRRHPGFLKSGAEIKGTVIWL